MGGNRSGSDRKRWRHLTEWRHTTIPASNTETPDEIDYGDFKIVNRVLERSDGSRRVWLKDSEGKILNIISK